MNQKKGKKLKYPGYTHEPMLWNSDWRSVAKIGAAKAMKVICGQHGWRVMLEAAFIVDIRAE